MEIPPLLRKSALFAAALLPGLCSAASPEWPQFRGPAGDGISSATKIPVEWSASNGIAWSVEVPGKGWSSPVLSKGRIYLTSAVEGASAEVTLNALCFDAESGKLLWNTEVFRPDPGEVKAMHRKNTAASPTPIAEDGKVYVHFGHMGTAALDLDGRVRWSQTSLKYKPVHGTGGSPALTGGMLVFSADGSADPFVAALDAQTGAVRWQTPRNTTAKKNFSFCTPQVITLKSGPQIILPGSGFVGAYRPSDGAELWRVNYGEGYSVVPRPVYSHGMLFLSSGFDSASLLAIRPEGAEGDATAGNVAWTLKKGAPHTPSVVVVENQLFCVSDAGIASCVDVQSGEVRWSERLAGNFSASPVAAEGRIYFQNEAGVGFVVKASSTYELLATNDLGEKTLASPAVADGTLFIRGEGHLFKISSSK
jgi:outer membrane protein assembly factor BamB